MTQLIDTNRTEKSVVQVLLSDLISLADTSFNLPTHAMRDRVHSHVLELAATDYTTWPPIKVVETDEGLAVIDGYHRWEALKRIVTVQALNLLEESTHKQDNAIKALNEGTLDIQPTVNAQLAETMIAVEIGVYPDEKAVGKAALTANLHHALPPEGKARVQIALELFDLTRGETPEPTQADIARTVGISRATLNEALTRRKNKASKEVPSKATGSPEGTPQESNPDKEAQEKNAEAKKKAEAYIKSLTTLSKEYPQACTEAIKVLFPFIVTEIAGTYATSMDKAYADSLASLFEAREVHTGLIQHITRLGGVLKVSAKTLEKSHNILTEKPTPNK